MNRRSVARRRSPTLHARRSRPFRFEPLEPRCLLSAAPHLGPAEFDSDEQAPWHDITPAQVETRIVTVDDPDNHLIAPGTGLGGVARLAMWGEMVTSSGLRVTGELGSCSGSLLPTGKHILTAAHCIENTVQTKLNGSLLTYSYYARSGTATLWTPDGREVQIPITAFHRHPQ